MQKEAVPVPAESGRVVEEQTKHDDRPVATQSDESVSDQALASLEVLAVKPDCHKRYSTDIGDGRRDDHALVADRFVRLDDGVHAASLHCVQKSAWQKEVKVHA